MGLYLLKFTINIQAISIIVLCVLAWSPPYAMAQSDRPGPSLNVAPLKLGFGFVKVSYRGLGVVNQRGSLKEKGYICILKL